jgi:CBS domain-containing protein
MLLRETPPGPCATVLRDEIEQPILVSEIVARAGSRSIHLRVFCLRREGSVSLDTCRECPALQEITGDPSGNGAWVRCSRTMPNAADALGPTGDGMDDPSFEGGPTGAVLQAAVSAVRDDLTLKELRSHFVEQLISSVFVVDESNRLLGIVREADLLASRLTARPTADHLARLASEGSTVTESVNAETAAKIMSPTPWVRENTGLRRALLEMARANQRRLAVVASDGTLLGILDDIAGLKWLVGCRTDCKSNEG